MDQLLQFIQEYWLGVLIGFIGLIIAMSFLKAIFKVVTLAIFIGLILIFGFNYSPKEVVDMGKESVTAVVELYNKELKSIVNAEISGAKVKQNPDGTYTIQTSSVQIVGKKGTPDATVIFKGKEYKVPVKSLGENVQKLMETAENEK